MGHCAKMGLFKGANPSYRRKLAQHPLLPNAYPES